MKRISVVRQKGFERRERVSEHFIETGDKLHIITRRLFPDDLRRHFVGEVTRAIGHLCHLQGYVFVFNSGTNEYRE